MIRALLLLSFVFAASGCATLTVVDVSKDATRRRQAEATGTAEALVAAPPTRGDTLSVRLADGQRLRGTFLGVTADTLRIAGPAGPFALGLAEVAEVQRPHREARYSLALVAAVAADLAFYYLVLRGSIYGY